jgi:hypothetical protein
MSSEENKYEKAVAHAKELLNQGYDKEYIWSRLKQEGLSDYEIRRLFDQ